MKHVFFFLIGRNFTTGLQTRLEDVPRLQLHEIEALLQACFPGTKIRPTYTDHRIVEARIPWFDEKVIDFMRRSVSIHLMGEVTCSETTDAGSIEEAIEDLVERVFMLDLEKTTEFKLKNCGRANPTFAIARVLHAMPMDPGLVKLIKQRGGEKIREQTGWQVRLVRPDLPVYVVITRERSEPFRFKMLLSVNAVHFKKKGYKERLARYRPRASIGTMNPPLSSLMCNLIHHVSGTGGCLLLDPFCGTGGILIEAIIRGFVVVGMDLRRINVEDARVNLIHYNGGNTIRIHMLVGSIFSIPFRDDIADRNHLTHSCTDPPYGRLESLGGASHVDLLETLIGELQNRVEHACFAFPVELEQQVVGVVEKHRGKNQLTCLRYYEHPSLTRGIYKIHSNGDPRA